jgi:hypothetical protein
MMNTVLGWLPEMTDWLKYLRKHLVLFLLVAWSLALLHGTIRLCFALTGRAPDVDLNDLVSWSITFCGLVGVIILVALCKGFIFDDTDTTKEDVPWWRVLIDSCETVFLLCFFAHYLWRH